MEYLSIYDNLAQIKKDLMDSVNHVQKRARLRLLNESDVEWAIKKIAEHSNGHIVLFGGIDGEVPGMYRKNEVATFVQVDFLRRKGKIAMRSEVVRENTIMRSLNIIEYRRFFKGLHLIAPFGVDILSLYGDFVGLRREIRLRKYIYFRIVREKIRNVLKQWEFVFPFHYEDFRIVTAIYCHSIPLLVIVGSEINSDKYVTYFILPKPYDSFRFDRWLIPPREKTKTEEIFEEIFKEVTGEKMPETPEEIAAILTMTAI